MLYQAQIADLGGSELTGETPSSGWKLSGATKDRTQIAKAVVFKLKTKLSVFLRPSRTASQELLSATKTSRAQQESPQSRAHITKMHANLFSLMAVPLLTLTVVQGSVVMNP
jgi:hypothetical protein